MTLPFAVRRREPVLVGPASPTPREAKRLSDLDSQDEVRMHIRGISFFRGEPARGGDDPVAILRRALSEALVHYYPLAGRLREEAEGRKLVVDCTGEGVLFVEADADVRLPELEAAGLMRAPFTGMDQLLFNVEGSDGFFNCPLMLIQVTRLLCGGFVIGTRLNHTMCDAVGIVQFTNAVAELARGLPAPTVAPAWSRELLEARSLPKPRENEAMPSSPVPAPPPTPLPDIVMRSFTFSPDDIVAMKEGLPPRLRDTATTFEVLAAALWRARTAALELPPGEDVRLAVIANARGIAGLGLPAGYYGNACVPTAALADAGALRGGSLGDAVELVREAKAAVTAEYVRSAVSQLVLRRRSSLFSLPNVFVLTDVRHAGFDRVDFGCGAPAYGGPITGALFQGSAVIAVKNGDGEDAAGVPVVLPRPAMERFAEEIHKLLTQTKETIQRSRMRL